jgi:vanillate O-demethylase ferredoxin subunit
LLRAGLQALPHLLEPDEAVSDGREWIEVRVSRRWAEAPDVVALELVACEGTLPAFDAGSFIDVLAPSGQVRSYSLCNAPHERHRYLIAVLREGATSFPRTRQSSASASLHDNVRSGDRLRIQGPRNAFPLQPVAVHSLLLAAGIGVTPLVPMAHTLWRRGSPFHLHYCARNRERAALHGALQDAPFHGHVQFHWSEQHGRADLRRLIAAAPPAAQVYACGPASFLRDAQRAFHALGRDPGRWHSESFAALPAPARAG